mmetsp:Transcript_9943/g.29366  ORF Transcript_9943/g.29366 Transcript_9943/m.29366 type:complete len:222 (-) Transcript_9943:62-727(-)
MFLMGAVAPPALPPTVLGGSAASAYVCGAVAMVLVAKVGRSLVAGGALAGVRPRRPGMAAPVAARDSVAMRARGGGGTDFGVWTVMRKQVKPMLKAWSENSSSSSMEGYLQNLSKLDIPKEWAVWGLADPNALPGQQGGFYLIPPGDAQIIVFMEAVDDKTVNVEHIAVNPMEMGKGTRKAVEDWIASLKPKKVIIRQPEEFALFELSAGGSGGAQVSKGL